MSMKKGAWLRANYRLLVVVILLIAAVLRIYGLNNTSPPGLEHDEVAHWLINRDILSGNLVLYYPEAYGHEAGYHYVQTIFMVLLGDNPFALRLPSAFFGLLLVAISFSLARRMFDLKTALLSTALLAVLFWPIFYSRLALRAISLPMLSGLSAYFWWKGWGRRFGGPAAHGEMGEEITYSAAYLLPSPAAIWFALAGLFAGLSFYSYLASRVIPVFYLLFVIYLALFHRRTIQDRWRELLLFFLVYIVVAAPLAIYLLKNPSAEVRIGEVDAPLQALMSGNLRPVAENALRVLAMFGIRGDPLWRQNVAHLPVFEPLLALFFYIGLLISLWRWRKPRYLFLILWLFTAAIPSIVTIEAPSSIRIINALPILTIFPVIGLEVIHTFRPLSTVLTKLSPNIVKFTALFALVIVLTLYIARSATALFQIWPKSEQVQFVWQKALTDAAGYLDVSGKTDDVAVGGWTPETMDPPTMALTLQRNDLDLRFFDPIQSLIIPFDPTGQTGQIVYPTALPLNPYLASILNHWGLNPHPMGAFQAYEIQQMPEIEPQHAAETDFGGEITFLGYDIPTSDGEPLPIDAFLDQDGLRLVTYWRVKRPADGPRRFFLHAVNEAGQTVTQDDRLGAPASHWKEGDLILQQHQLTLPPTGEQFSLELGVYNPETGQRLLTESGADFVMLPKQW